MNKETRILYRGRNVGILITKGIETIFQKFVNPRKHFFRMYMGYGIQKEVFDKLLKNRKGRVIINEKGGKTFESSIKEWEKRGIEGDWGDGEQVFLPIRFMRDLNGRQKILF